MKFVELTLNYTQSYQLSVKGSTATPSWSSENEYIATVNSAGLVTAIHVGETFIVCNVNNETLRCQITVKPMFSLYDEPLHSFGESMESIKNSETRELLEENSKNLVYNDPKAMAIMYLFEANKMIGSAALLSMNTEAESVVKFLTERYDVVGQNGDFFIWAGDDIKIVLSVIQSGILIMYAPLEIGYSNAPLMESFHSLNKTPYGVDSNDLITKTLEFENCIVNAINR